MRWYELRCKLRARRVQQGSLISFNCFTRKDLFRQTKSTVSDSSWTQQSFCSRDSGQPELAAGGELTHTELRQVHKAAQQSKDYHRQLYCITRLRLFVGWDLPKKLAKLAIWYYYLLIKPHYLSDKSITLGTITVSMYFAVNMFISAPPSSGHWKKNCTFWHDLKKLWPLNWQGFSTDLQKPLVRLYLTLPSNHSPALKRARLPPDRAATRAAGLCVSVLPLGSYSDSINPGQSTTTQTPLNLPILHPILGDDYEPRLRSWWRD